MDGGKRRKSKLSRIRFFLLFLFLHLSCPLFVCFVCSLGKVSFVKNETQWFDFLEHVRVAKCFLTTDNFLCCICVSILIICCILSGIFACLLQSKFVCL